MKNNLILVGMPACGKSTVGVILAKTVNKDFVDTDLLIQKREGKTLQEIINSRGNEAFGEIEEQVLMDFDGENCVVSTGGSAIYYPDVMEKFRREGRVIYIKVSLDTVLERLHNIKTRGVTLGEGQTLEDLYKERTPLYEKRSEITIEADGMSVEDVVTAIVEKLGFN